MRKKVIVVILSLAAILGMVIIPTSAATYDSGYQYNIAPKATEILAAFTGSNLKSQTAEGGTIEISSSFADNSTNTITFNTKQEVEYNTLYLHSKLTYGELFPILQVGKEYHTYMEGYPCKFLTSDHEYVFGDPYKEYYDHFTYTENIKNSEVVLSIEFTLPTTQKVLQNIVITYNVKPPAFTGAAGWFEYFKESISLQDYIEDLKNNSHEFAFGANDTSKYDEGYNSGYNEGFAAGESQGYEDGKNEGVNIFGKIPEWKMFTTALVLFDTTDPSVDSFNIEMELSQNKLVFKDITKHLIENNMPIDQINTFTFRVHLEQDIEWSDLQMSMTNIEIEKIEIFKTASDKKILKAVNTTSPNLFNLVADNDHAETTNKSEKMIYDTMKFYIKAPKENTDFSLICYDRQYDAGYNTGLQDGAEMNNEGVYNEGHKDGYTTGYSKGKKDGQMIAELGDWKQLITSVIESPVKAFQTMFNFEILGMNLTAAYGAILALCVLLIILKKVIS